MIMQDSFFNESSNDRDFIQQHDVFSKIQLQCVNCVSGDVYAVLPTCLHLVCRECLESLKVDGKYCCSACNEYSEKVLFF